MTGNERIEVFAVIVTYGPDIPELERLLRRLVPELRRVVVTDNSGPVEAGVVQAVVERSGAVYIRSGGNVGVATAQNRGMRFSVSEGATTVLLLDDDSSMDARDVQVLLAFLRRSRKSDPSVAAVGPRVIDRRTNEELNPVLHGTRVVFEPVSEVSEAAFLLGSGTLIDVEALERHGYLRDEYFIDHVDKEWGYRVRTQGGTLLITPDVVLLHRLGEDPVLRDGKWVNYVQSNPMRHYYMARNSLLLLRDVPLPPLARVRETVVVARFMLRRLLGNDQPHEVKRAVLKGLVDGLRNHRVVEPQQSMTR